MGAATLHGWGLRPPCDRGAPANGLLGFYRRGPVSPESSHPPDYAGLDISRDGADTLIDTGAGILRLLDTAPAELTADVFLF